MKRSTGTHENNEMMELFVFIHKGYKIIVIDIFKKIDDKISNLTKGIGIKIGQKLYKPKN